MDHETIGKILVTAMFVTGFFVVITVFIAELNTNYDVRDYYAENLTSYQDALTSVQEQTEQVSEAMNQLSTGNVFDILGALLQGVLATLGLYIDSFVAIGAIFTQSLTVFKLGSVTSTWIAIASSSVLVFFLMFLIKKVR